MHIKKHRGVFVQSRKNKPAEVVSFVRVCVGLASLLKRTFSHPIYLVARKRNGVNKHNLQTVGKIYVNIHYLQVSIFAACNKE